MSKIYRMCKEQPVQLDCRRSNCLYHANGSCTNTSPALTVNDKKAVCWSMKEREGSRIINLDNDNNKDTCLELLITPTERVIRVSLLFAAMVGDELWCDGGEYQIVKVLDERPDWQRQGFTYQKLLIEKLWEA